MSEDVYDVARIDWCPLCERPQLSCLEYDEIVPVDAEMPEDYEP